MARYSMKDVEHATSRLAKLLGTPLHLSAWSPGDRHGTRYQLYTEGDTPGSLGRQLLAECGARATTEAIRHMVDGAHCYRQYNEAPTPPSAITQLHDIEA